MAQTKTLLLRNRDCTTTAKQDLDKIDRMARAFLGMSSSERLGATLLVVTVLFTLVGLLATAVTSLSMPALALALGVLLGAPALVLSLLDRNRKQSDDS